MTLNQFAEINDIRTKKVIEWLEEGFIPGSYFDEENQSWVIPDSARLPYTKARAKAKHSIYQSIVKAVIKHKHVFPKLYNITQQEFDSYIRVLVNAGYINLRVEDNVTYYDESLTSRNFLVLKVKQINDLVSVHTEAISKGVTSAMLDKGLSA